METGQMTCALQVDTQTPGWHKTLTKVLKSIGGLAFTIDAPQGIARVSGNIDPGKPKQGSMQKLCGLIQEATQHVQQAMCKEMFTSPMALALVLHRWLYLIMVIIYVQYPYHQYGYDPHYHMFSQYQLPYYDVYTPPTTPYSCLYPSYCYYDQPALYFPQAPPPVANQRLESFCNMM